MTHKVAFIGMGIMGQPMAKNVLARGHEVMVFNRHVEKTLPLAEFGAKVARTPVEAAQWADVIILMLTGPEAIDAVVFEENGLLTGRVEGKTLINMSTVSPAYTRQIKNALEPHGVVFLDAPVSGSKKPAEDGSLVILASGPREAVVEMEPLLLTMGKKVVYCGDAGQGSAMKMVINLLLGIMMEGLCEAVNLGQRLGLGTETILDTVLSGPLGCGLFNLKAGMLKSGTFPTQFPFKHMTKDIRFVLQTADNAGAAVPAGHALFQVFRQGLGQDLGDLDFAAVKEVLETMSDR
jgi:3-hydroxyisobutyrate dehydrogenase-like beta-hydroxyacid dehydrogenase